MTEERRRFTQAERKGRKMAPRIMYSLPEVSDLEELPITSRVDFKFRSGETKTFLELKYREDHNHTEYRNVRIQASKYEAVKRKKGFLLQIFEDSWWLWYLGDTEPCDRGWWSHCEHTVLGDETITDEYVAFDYKDALYFKIK